jgi:hypothetical protein
MVVPAMDDLAHWQLFDWITDSGAPALQRPMVVGLSSLDRHSGLVVSIFGHRSKQQR